MRQSTLEGKVAIVTGAGSGLGLATARLFAEQGARVVALDIVPERLVQLDQNPAIVTVVGDVANSGDVDRMIDTALERFGKLDILVNDAGVVDPFLPVVETTDDIWLRELAVNLTGPFLSSRRAIPIMLEAGCGGIFNISSQAGLAGGRAGAAYSASKHGLIGLTKNIAATYGNSGIRCVAVCPGGMQTRMAADCMVDPSERGFSTMQRTCRSQFRLADPKEVANVVLFFASDAASFVNGAVVVADGGGAAH